MWLYTTESLVKCTLISDCALLKSAWHAPGKRERDPAWLASHIKVRDARGNEGGDRHSERGPALAALLKHSMSSQPSNGQRQRVSHAFRVKMNHRLPKEKAQGQRDSWTLTHSRLHYYLQKLCWTFETFSDKCQIFSDHRKQDFFALLK